MNLEQNLEDQLLRNNREKLVEKNELFVRSEKSKKESNADVLVETADVMEAETEIANVTELGGEKGAERFFAKREVAKYIASTLDLKEDESLESRSKRLKFELDSKKGDEYIEATLGVGTSQDIEEINDDISKKRRDEKDPVSAYVPLAFMQKKLGENGQGTIGDIAERMRNSKLNYENKDNQDYRTYMDAKVKGDQEKQKEFLPDANVRIGLFDSNGRPAFKFEVTSPWGLDSWESIKKVPDVIRGKINKLSTLSGCLDTIKESVLMMQVGPEKIIMKK